MRKLSPNEQSVLNIVRREKSVTAENIRSQCRWARNNLHIPVLKELVKLRLVAFINGRYMEYIQ